MSTELEKLVLDLIQDANNKIDPELEKKEKIKELTQKLSILENKIYAYELNKKYGLGKSIKEPVITCEMIKHN